MSSSDFSDVDEPMLAAPPSAASAKVASSVTPAAVPGNDITFYAAVGLPVPFDVPALEVPQVEYRYGGSHFPWKPLPLVPLTPELAPDDLQGGYTCRLTAPIHIRRDGQSGASATKTEDSKLQFRFKGRAGVSPDDMATIDAVEDIDEQSRVAVAAWPGRESSPLLSPSGPAKLPLVAGASPFPHPPTKSVLYLQILPGDMTADPVLSLIRFPRHDQLVQIAKRKAEAEEERRQQAAKAARDKEDREKRMKEDQERRAQQEKERKLRDEQERLEKEKVAKEKAIRDAISEAESAQMLSSSKPERKDTLVPATVTPIRTLSDVPLSSQSNATSALPQQPAFLGAVVSKPAQPQQEKPISEEWSRSAKPAPRPQPKPAPPAPKKFVGEELLEDDEVSPPKRHRRQQQSDIIGGAPSLPRLIITPLPKPLSSSAVPPPPPFEPPSMVSSQFTRCGGMGMGLLSGGLVISTGRPSDAFYRYSNGKGTWEELRFGGAPSTPDVAAASVGFAGRHGHSACFSPVDHRVYIYGGMGLGGFDPVREAQALRSLSAKQKIQYFSEMSKEGSRKQIGYLDDLWAVDTEDLTLTRLVFPDDEVGLDGETSNGLPLRAQRSYRYQQSSVIDAEGNLVLVGGRTATFLAEIPDANSPDRRVNHSKSSDRHKAAEVTVFEEDVTFAAEETCCSLQYLDVCNVILASTSQRLRPKKLRNQPLWRVVEATGDVPSPRFGHSMDRSKSGDPLGVHAYLFGGCSSAATHLNDLFSLNTDTWIWTRISLAVIPRFVALQSPSVISATVAGRLCLVVSGTTAQVVADPDDEGSRDNSDDSDADGSKTYFTPKFQCVVVDLSSSTSSKARPVGLGGTGNPATGRGPSVSFVSASAPIYGHAVAVTSTAQRHNQYSGRLPCKTRSLLSLTLFGGQSSEVADLPFVASAKVNANGLVLAVSDVSKGLGMGGGSSSHTTTMSLREDIHGQGVQLCVSAQLRATKGWTVGRMSMLPDFVDPASIAASTTFRDSAAPLDRNIVSASKPREGWQIQASVGRLSTLTSRQRAALVASHPEKFKEELATQQDKEHRERQKRAVPQEKIQEVAQRLHDQEMAVRAKRKAQAQKEEEERIQADVRKTAKPRSKDEDNRDEDWWRERFLKSKVPAATSPPRPQTAATPRRITSEKQLADANAQLYYTAVKNKNETMKKLEEEVCGVPEKVPRLTQEAMQKSIGRLYRGPPSPLSSHKGRPQSATARTHNRRVAL